MECRHRRGRRGRGRSYGHHHVIIDPPTSNIQPCPQRNLSNSVTSFLILTSLIGVIYLMLDYHCMVCSEKYKSNVTTSLEQIMKNVSQIKDNFNNLETKFILYTQILPRIEGQLELLDVFTNAADRKEFVLEPKSQTISPKDVDEAIVTVEPKTLSELPETSTVSTKIPALFQQNYTQSTKIQEKSSEPIVLQKCTSKLNVTSSLKPVIIKKD